MVLTRIRDGRDQQSGLGRADLKTMGMTSMTPRLWMWVFPAPTASVKIPKGGTGPFRHPAGAAWKVLLPVCNGFR